MTASDNTTAVLDVGFIGLGDMGAPMANNIANRYTDGGLNMTVFDIKLAADRVPDSANIAESLTDVAISSEVVFVSVPDGKSSLKVVEGLLESPKSRVKAVINLSTIGIADCERIVKTIPKGGFEYIDAPVSGGKTGAINGTITLMWSGSKEVFNNLQSVCAAFAKSIFFVGDKAGQGQAVKLLNNFLSGVAMTATSEAMRFGLHHGLDMKTMLDVVHVSTGQNTAISDKFPNRILTGTYDAGFRMELMQKDIALFQQGVAAAGLPSNIADVVSAYWTHGIENHADADFTEIFKLIG